MKHLQEVSALSDLQLENIWYILVDCSSTSNHEELNFEDISQALALCQEACGPGLEQYFSASNFLRLARGASGTVSCASFFGYLMRRNSMLQLQSLLKQEDRQGRGSVTEEGLRKLLAQLLPSMQALCKLVEPDMQEEYLNFAVSTFKVFFYGKRRMKIKDLLLSFAMADFLELKLPAEDLQISNCLSFDAFEALHIDFKVLDTEETGYVTEEQFKRYNQGAFTPLCVSRLFELQGQQIDGSHSTAVVLYHKEFVEFVTAWKYRHLDSSCMFLFQLLDYEARGYISEETIYIFLKDLQQAWPAHLQEMVPVIDTVHVELMDMLGAAEPSCIWPGDFMASEAGKLVIGILLNIQQFWEYDCREELMQAAANSD